MQAPKWEAWQEIAFLKEVCKLWLHLHLVEGCLSSAALGLCSWMVGPLQLCVFAKGGFVLGSLGRA